MLPFEHYLLRSNKITKIKSFNTNLEDEASFSSQIFFSSLTNICTKSYSTTSIILDEKEIPQSNTGLENEFSSAASDNTLAGAQGTSIGITTVPVVTPKDNTKQLPLLDNEIQNFKEILDKILNSQNLRDKELESIKQQLYSLSKGSVKELQHLPNKEESKESDPEGLPSYYKSEILDINKLNSIDFVLQSNESQEEIDSHFNFKVLQYSKNIVPDNDLVHLKSPINRDILNKLLILSFKLKIWSNIYDNYFKSIFKLISNLQPMKNKYFRGLNTMLIEQDSLSSTPASRMLYSYDSPLAKIVYGYANGLYDMSCFLPTKFFKVDINYEFNTTKNRPKSDKGGVSRAVITIVWYYLNDEGKVKKVSKETNLTDFSYEYSTVQDSFKFKEDSTIFNRSQDLVYSALFDLKSSTKAKTLQTSTSSRMSVGSTEEDSTTYSQGFVSRMMINGNISFDLTNSQLFNSLSTLLAIEYLNINVIDDDCNTLITEISQYVSTMIYQFAIDRIRPKNTLISDISCNLTIEKNKNLRSGDDLHNSYKDLVNKGKIFPITPVQFDYYFNKDTIFKFSEFIVLSSLSNVSINSDLHSVLPFTNSISKRNFSHYSRDRKCLSSKAYTPDIVFDFEDSKFSLKFEQFLIELYVRTVLTSKVPDYIPLITRGQWNSGNIKSLEISTPYLNNYFVKFDLSDYQTKTDNFVLDIICQSEDTRLDKNFRNKTRLTLECPKMFNRFILSDEPECFSIHDEYTITPNNEQND